MSFPDPYENMTMSTPVGPINMRDMTDNLDTLSPSARLKVMECPFNVVRFVEVAIENEDSVESFLFIVIDGPNGLEVLLFFAERLYWSTGVEGIYDPLAMTNTFWRMLFDAVYPQHFNLPIDDFDQEADLDQVQGE